jgi:hypothetical protein
VRRGRMRGGPDAPSDHVRRPGGSPLQRRLRPGGLRRRRRAPGGPQRQQPRIGQHG